MKTQASKGKKKKHLFYYLMMLPGLAYFLINDYIPMAGILLAFKKINYTIGLLKSEWVWLDNFRFLFHTKDAFIITRNTVLYNLLFIALDMILGILVAIFLSEMRRKRLSRFYQSSLMLPNLVSMVIVSYLAFAFLSSENGFMNKTLLPLFGAPDRSWYSTPGPWPLILTIVHCWCSIGTSAIIYLSAIVGIDKGLYESAELDGAGKWRQILHITLPHLKSTVVILTLMSIGSIFFSNFGLFYLVPMNSGMLYDVTATLDTYVYNGLMKLNNISMASAAGVYQSLVGFVLVVASNALVKKIDPDNALF